MAWAGRETPERFEPQVCAREDLSLCPQESAPRIQPVANQIH